MAACARCIRLGGIVVLVLASVCSAAPAQAATVTVDDPVVTEGQPFAVFTVTLTSVEPADVTVDYETQSGTADAVDDFLSTTGQLTWDAESGETNGQTSKTVSVPITDDEALEPPEEFYLIVTGAGIENQPIFGTATILDDDAPPPAEISISDTTVFEPDSGTVNASFSVTLSDAAPDTVTVDYATANETATAPGDYTPSSGTVTFAPGDTSETVTVPVLADTIDEADERFLVGLSNPSPNALIADGLGQGTIREPFIGFVRPKFASLTRVSLVPAFTRCAQPNRMHGPPLAHSSCGPPTPISPNLTVGSPDANGQAAEFVGHVLYSVVVGNPGTTVSEADVRFKVALGDVRNASDLSDYEGELQASVGLRLTDRDRSFGVVTSTLQDFALSFTLRCMPTQDSTVGSACGAATTANALTPGAVVEGSRAVWELGQVRVFDGGDDGFISTGDNSVFAKQGIFVP